MPTPENEKRIRVGGGESPLRGVTANLSLGGCYVETLFPLAIGTTLELKLQVHGTLLVLAEVATCDPQVGNGIQFTKMLPEDTEELRVFLDALGDRERSTRNPYCSGVTHSYGTTGPGLAAWKADIFSSHLKGIDGRSRCSKGAPT